MYVRNILFALGVLALIAGASLAVLWVRQGPGGAGDAQMRAAAQGISVLVAADALPAGTLLRKDDMAWKAIPPNRVPPAAVRNGNGNDKEFLGAVTRRSFAAGEPLVMAGVIKPGDRDFLAAVLAPGMRAVSLPVDAASGVAGLVQPGDYVDVILAQSLNNSGNGGRSAVSETVLHDVRVVAVDQWFSPDDKPHAVKSRFGPASSSLPKTVTLEVNEQNAKRLLLAAQLGKITLAMRALRRPQTETGHLPGGAAPVWAGDVSPALRGVASAARPMTGSVSVPRRSIRIIRGSKVNTQ